MELACFLRHPRLSAVYRFHTGIFELPNTNPSGRLGPRVGVLQHHSVENPDLFSQNGFPAQVLWPIKC